MVSCGGCCCREEVAAAAPLCFCILYVIVSQLERPNNYSFYHLRLRGAFSTKWRQTRMTYYPRYYLMLLHYTKEETSLAYQQSRQLCELLHCMVSLLTKYQCLQLKYFCSNGHGKIFCVVQADHCGQILALISPPLL